jgi:hypothetical protein
MITAGLLALHLPDAFPFAVRRTVAKDCQAIRCELQLRGQLRIYKSSPVFPFNLLMLEHHKNRESDTNLICNSEFANHNWAIFALASINPV